LWQYKGEIYKGEIEMSYLDILINLLEYGNGLRRFIHLNEYAPCLVGHLVKFAYLHYEDFLQDAEHPRIFLGVLNVARAEFYRS